MFMLRIFIVSALICSGCVLAADEAPAVTTHSATTRPAVAERISCSTLCQVKQPLEKAAKVIAEMGYKYVDLSCFNWPPGEPHANVAELLKDLDKEATRIEGVLKKCDLKASNLTYDGLDAKNFGDYVKRYEAVIKLAARLKAPLLNLMAPPKDADRQDVVAKLKVLQAIAEKHKIKLTLETHCYQITELPADALWLCKQVSGVGLTLDPSHYYAGPNQGKPFDDLYPYVGGTGFRAGAMTWKTIQLPWGEGPIDFAAIVHNLEAKGYRGFYVAEYIEGFNELDAVKESRRFLDWARKLK